MTLSRRTHLVVVAVACLIAPARGGADESAALAVLASPDAAVYDKAMACDELGRVGTATSVPALAELLAHEQIHDYARDGLERIQDPAAGQALLEALKTLKGGHRIGVIITLGDRREPAAVPALAQIAQEKGGSHHARGAALSSLAQIATDDVAPSILTVLADGEEASRALAAQAALAAAQRMEKGGRTDAARKLRNAVASADVPAYMKQAAGN